MRKIISNFFISLDGVVEAPEKWHFQYFDDDMSRVVESGMATQTAFLLGRRLYDEWSQFWPANTEDGFGRYINALPKYVLTHRPMQGELWNNTTVLDGEGAVEAIRAVKAGGSGDIGMSGCATTVRWLIANGLLDELNLLVHPIAVGTGQRLFEHTGTMPLTLISSATFDSGVLHLRYAPAATS